MSPSVTFALGAALDLSIQVKREEVEAMRTAAARILATNDMTIGCLALDRAHVWLECARSTCVPLDDLCEAARVLLAAALRCTDYMFTCTTEVHGRAISALYECALSQQHDAMRWTHVVLLPRMSDAIHAMTASRAVRAIPVFSSMLARVPDTHGDAAVFLVRAAAFAASAFVPPTHESTAAVEQALGAAHQVLTVEAIPAVRSALARIGSVREQELAQRLIALSTNV